MRDANGQALSYVYYESEPGAAARPIFSVRFFFLFATDLQAQRHFSEQLVGFRASDEFDIDASVFDLFNRVLDAFESRHGGVLVNRANVQLAVAAPASGHREVRIGRPSDKHGAFVVWQIV